MKSENYIITCYANSTNMKIAKPIETSPVENQPDVVYFRCKNVEGLAYLKNGCGESDYDLLEVEKITNGNKSIVQEIKQYKNEIGAFVVIGQVDEIWEDGVFTIESNGFDFWVNPEEYAEPVTKSEWYRISVRNFTLYL